MLKFTSSLIDPYIITLYDIRRYNDNRLAYLMEYADCGSLYTLLHTNENKYPYIQALKWMQQFAKVNSI